MSIRLDAVSDPEPELILNKDPTRTISSKFDRIQIHNTVYNQFRFRGFATHKSIIQAYGSTDPDPNENI
jgi:hypothetical protein